MKLIRGDKDGFPDGFLSPLLIMLEGCLRLLNICGLDQV